MRNIDLFMSLLSVVPVSYSDNVFIQKDEFSQYVRDILDESGCERSENEKEANVEVEEVLARRLLCAEGV